MPGHAFIRWLDRYIHVDRLRIRWADILPRMRWWEWVWYVAAVMAGWHGFAVLDHWLAGQVDRVPVLRWAPFLVTWPVMITLYAIASRYLLPAWERRRSAPGEAWLMGALVAASLLADLLVFDRPLFG